MLPLDNPFVVYNEDKGNKVVAPSFKRNMEKRFTITLSDEAYAGLTHLSKEFTNEPTFQGGINRILELIGLYSLKLSLFDNEIDEESGASLEDCRQSGYEDGVQGNVQLFLIMFDHPLPSKFHHAYMRGFFEGNYIRTTNK